MNHYIELDANFKIQKFDQELPEMCKPFKNIYRRAHFPSICSEIWRDYLALGCQDALDYGKTTTWRKKIPTIENKFRWTMIEVYPIVSHRKIMGVKIDFRDLAKKVFDNEQKKTAQKWNSIAFMASHFANAFNNPLATMLNKIGCLLMEDLHNKNIDHTRNELQNLQEEIYSLSIITNALNSFSNESFETFKILNVNSIVEKSIELSKLVHTHSIKYKIRLHSDLPFVYGDEITLEQCFINIIRNALEAMPDGGTLMLTTKLDKNTEDHIEMVFKDTGIGIPNDHMNYIFDPFFKTKNSDHSGLGLTVCYGIVANHNGYIRIKSREKIGTKVSILLPVYKK